MKTRLLLFSLLFSLSALAATVEKPEYHYSASCMKSNCVISKPQILFVGDSLYIYDCVSANCCANFELNVSEPVNDTLTVTFTDTASLLCTCSCDFSVTINAGKIASKDIVVQYSGESYPMNAKAILPIIEKGKTWNVETINMAMGPLPVTAQYMVEPNSERPFCWNGLFYTKISKSHLIALKSGSLNNEAVYIREYNGKVYYMDDTTQCREILIYDFTLNKGDSVTVGDSNDYLSHLKVDSVNYIQYNDGVSRKTMYLSGDGNKIWIEGIGDTNSPFYYWLPLPNKRCKCGDSSYEKLICCSVNDKLIYRTPGYYSCVIISSATDFNYSFSIYPNPASSYLNVESTVYTGVSYTITDLSGNIVQKGNLSDEININIPDGMYFISLSDDKGIIGAEKILIEGCK